MSPETRALILTLLEKHTPSEVHAMMRRNLSTEPVEYAAIRSLRRGMLGPGVTRHRVGGSYPQYTPEERRARDIARLRERRLNEKMAGCPFGEVDPSRRLLRRQLETGQHTISCPDLMARALREAGMVA